MRNRAVAALSLAWAWASVFCAPSWGQNAPAAAPVPSASYREGALTSYCARRPIACSLGVVTAVAAAAVVDEPLRHGVQVARGTGLPRLMGRRLGDHGSVADVMGGPAILGVAGAFYLGGLASGSEKPKRVGVLATEAFLLNGVLTQGGKRVVGRHGPSGPNHAFDFSPLKNGDGSFPSGHTSNLFAAASVISEHYDSLWVGGAAYGTAAVFGFATMYQDFHWASDVVAGAALGTIVGKGLCYLENKKGWSRRLYATPRGVVYQQRF